MTDLREDFELRVLDEVPPFPELDLDLLRDTLEWAKKSQEAPDAVAVNWKQSTWVTARLSETDLGELQFIGGRTTKEAFYPEHFCNTTACIAGRVALVCGGQPFWTEDTYKWQADYVMVGTKVENIGVFAAKKLGLTSAEETYMFYQGADLDLIEYVAQRACERRGLVW